MRFGRGGIVGLLAAGMLVLGACDDRSEVPPDLLSQPPEAPAEPAEAPSTRPTTQELVEGGRVPIKLDQLPLSLRVPTPWKITRHGTSGNIVWLEGPTPAGEVQLQLKTAMPLPSNRFDELLLGTQRDLDRPREPGGYVDLRRLGPAYVIERRSVGQAFTTPVLDDQGLQQLDEKGDLRVHTIIPMRWRINVYVPAGEQVHDYELSFIDLERPQYEADRAFLEDILKTLQYLGPEAAPIDDPPPVAPAGPEADTGRPPADR